MRRLIIDRSRPFNIKDFFGECVNYPDGRWSIEEEDERSITLTEVDLNTVCLKSYLNVGEPHITGEERILRIKKSGDVRLDAQILESLWHNKNLIPYSWKEEVERCTKRINFDGTVFRVEETLPPKYNGSCNILTIGWVNGDPGSGWEKRIKRRDDIFFRADVTPVLLIN